MIEKLIRIVGRKYVLTRDEAGAYSRDWIGAYRWTPLAVVRPKNTDQVSKIVTLANETNTSIVPVSGNTGLAGGTNADGAIMISLDRLNAIREIRPDARVAIVEAGVVLSTLHDATDADDLIFPLTFGARGSAMLGGCLSTNAGGSNVLRYGNTRDLCLGLEVVMPNGDIMNIMSQLHKDNSGYDLKHLMIGAEGTLGIITAATLKLFPKPRAYATAMVAAPSLDDALTLLNRLQMATGGAVEAFEFMPKAYIQRHLELYPEARAPFENLHEVNILVEVGATSPRDSNIGDDGQIPIIAFLEKTLADLFNEGAVLDAVIAQNDTQRQEMWDRREAAAYVTLAPAPYVNTDIAVPLDKVAAFLDNIHTRLRATDVKIRTMYVAHLGDGNVHFAAWPTDNTVQARDNAMEAVEEEALALGGSFSAEHGVGVSKLPSMKRRKDPVSLATMRAIKSALDPKNIMNPGKVLPNT